MIFPGITDSINPVAFKGLHIFPNFKIYYVKYYVCFHIVDCWNLGVLSGPVKKD